MIKKTLTVTLQEKDAYTKEIHDILNLKRGNEVNVILEFANPSGKLIVNKQDLYDGIREIELFYGDKTSKFDLPIVVNIEAPTQCEPHPRQQLSDDFNEAVDAQINKEIEDAAQAIHIPIVYGEDGA